MTLQSSPPPMWGRVMRSLAWPAAASNLAIRGAAGAERQSARRSPEYANVFDPFLGRPCLAQTAPVSGLQLLPGLCYT